MDRSKEPSAESRQQARFMFEWYNALRLEGFTEYEACAIIGTMLGTAAKGGNTDG